MSVLYLAGAPRAGNPVATGARDLRAAAGRFDSDDHVADHNDSCACDKQHDGFEHRGMAERRSEHRVLGAGCACNAGDTELSDDDCPTGGFTGTVGWPTSIGDTEWHFGRRSTELNARGGSAGAPTGRSPSDHIAEATKFGFRNYAKERISR